MTPQDPPGVYISPAQTAAEVRRIADGQIRMEAKLDSVLSDQRENRAAIADHETRLRSIEGARWPLPTIGAITGIAGAIAAAVALFR